MSKPVIVVSDPSHIEEVKKAVSKPKKKKIKLSPHQVERIENALEDTLNNGIECNCAGNCERSCTFFMVSEAISVLERKLKKYYMKGNY